MSQLTLGQGYLEAKSYAKTCDDADKIRKALKSDDADYNKGVEKFIELRLGK